MEVLITSGGTREYIDDVRVMTNISSGRLGAIIAERFLTKGHDVTYLHSKSAILPETMVGDSVNFVVANSVMDVYSVMEQIVPNYDIIIHAMAISDFTFERSAVKCSSNSAEAFIEFMRKNIKVAPKILPNIKVWNPTVKLVSFKFQVGTTEAELKDIAMNQLHKTNSDFVLANDKTVMTNAKAHIGHLYNVDGDVKVCTCKNNIAQVIYEATTNATQ